jgi:hypothetical protein
MSKAPHPYQLLSFVRTFDKKKDKAALQKWGSAIDYWHTTPTGDFKRDRAMGHGFAWEALDMGVSYRHAHNDPPEAILRLIMGDMIRHGRWGDVEWGFINMLAGLATMPVRIIKGQQPTAGKFCVLTPMLPEEGQRLPSRRTIGTVDD